MNVLVMGYRKGLCIALEKLNIDYSIWHTKTIKTERKAWKIVVDAFPKTEALFRGKLSHNLNITHVIAGTEDSVFPTALVRKWLDTKRYPVSVATKCTDKLKMKIYLKEKGIPMTPFLGKQMYQGSDKTLKDFGEKLIVKPRKSSGGRGLQVITDKSQIDKALNNRTLLEKSIEGSEGSVESLIEDGVIKFTNISQYKDIGICNYVPGHYSQARQKEILDLNQTVISALKIKSGITHLEFYNTSDGLLFGEVALRPPGGYIMEAMEQAYGCDFWDLLVRIELGLKVNAFPVQACFAASRIIYPKLGKISEITGVEDAKKLSSVCKIKLKAKVGQEVKTRAGVGEDFGYCIYANEDKKQLVSDIAASKRLLKIKTT